MPNEMRRNVTDVANAIDARGAVPMRATNMLSTTIITVNDSVETMIGQLRPRISNTPTRSGSS